MKSNFILSLLSLSLLFTHHANAKCNCTFWMRVYNDGIYTQYWAGGGQQLTDVYIAPGDSIKFYVNSSHGCNTNDLLFIYNGDTLFNGGAGDPDPGYSFTATDTGYYFMRYFYNVYYFYFNVHLQYTSVTEVKTEAIERHPEVIPLTSSGIFKINGCNVNQVRVVDLTGRIVLDEKRSTNEINLEKVPPGLYFYALTDEKNRLWFGRIVKQ